AAHISALFCCRCLLVSCQGACTLEGGMNRGRSMVRALPVILLLCGLTGAQAAERFRTPRTSWGDPVIQGTYTNNTSVPFERAPELGDKAFFTEQEYAARSKRPVVVETTTVVTDVHYETADYGLDPSQSQMVKSLRTSILTRPANGRMPPLRADARQRSDAARAAQQ